MDNYVRSEMIHTVFLKFAIYLFFGNLYIYLLITFISISSLYVSKYIIVVLIYLFSLLYSNISKAFSAASCSARRRLDPDPMTGCVNSSI